MKKIVRSTDQMVIVSQLKVANDFLSRLRGLIGVRSFNLGEGLYFPRCNSVHMWLMSIPIDVVFLKKQHGTLKIVQVFSNIKPWRLFPVAAWSADDALELPAGAVAHYQLKNEEVLCIVS